MKHVERMPPRISIGLPVYNAERYVEEAIAAHLRQSYRHFELLISDNASTDRTREICEHFAARDARVRYVRAEVNRGLTWNHRWVLGSTRAPLFRWAAADDVPEPTLLGEMVEILREDPQLVLCAPKVANIDRDGQLTGTIAGDLEAREPGAAQRVQTLLSKPHQMVFPQGLMRREVLESLPMNWNHVGWDFSMLLAFALRGPIAQTRTARLLRRHHSEQATRVQRDLRSGLAVVEPTLRRAWFLPQWRWAFERFRIAARTPLPIASKLDVFRVLARHAWWARAQLSHDVAATLRVALGRSTQAPY